MSLKEIKVGDIVMVSVSINVTKWNKESFWLTKMVTRVTPHRLEVDGIEYLKKNGSVYPKVKGYQPAIEDAKTSTRKSQLSEMREAEIEVKKKKEVAAILERSALRPILFLPYNSPYLDEAHRLALAIQKLADQINLLNRESSRKPSIW